MATSSTTEKQEEVLTEEASTQQNMKDGPYNAPICIIVLGMAGCGKTTFVRQLVKLSFNDFNPYVVNLDPACFVVPYKVNIDIRNTINYKKVMEEYKMGPNGAIVTSLNLFATKINNAVELIRGAAEKGHKWCIIDTPGQIEVFTWSASGAIITESLATTFPTIIIYVLDVQRSMCPTTFMSNMLYACSILYKFKLPFIIVLNKIDLQDCDFIMDWMTDFEAFHEALEKDQNYVNNLTRSMSLTLDSFYENLQTCGVSSLNGSGFGKMFNLIAQAVTEYEKDFKQIYLKLREESLKKPKKHLDSKTLGSSSEVNFFKPIDEDCALDKEDDSDN